MRPRSWAKPWRAKVKRMRWRSSASRSLHLDGERLAALDPAAAAQVAEAPVELGQLLVVGRLAHADHQLLADVAQRVVVGVEVEDLVGGDRAVVGDEEEADVVRGDEAPGHQLAPR